jgi:hypothetical protein
VIFHPDNFSRFHKKTNHFMLCADPIDYRCLPNRYCHTAVQYPTMGNGEMKLEPGCVCAKPRLSYCRIVLHDGEWGNEIRTRMCVCQTDIVILQDSIPRWGMGNGEMKSEPGCCVCKTDIVILQYSIPRWGFFLFFVFRENHGKNLLPVARRVAC